MGQLEPALLAEVETSNIAMAEKQRISKEIERMREELARKANTILPALKTEMTNTEVIALTQNLCGVDVSIREIYFAKANSTKLTNAKVTLSEIMPKLLHGSGC
jgi:hypothetical protein